jgi:hypothetical protein
MVLVQLSGAISRTPTTNARIPVTAGHRTVGRRRQGATIARVTPRRRNGAPMLKIASIPNARSTPTRVQ